MSEFFLDIIKFIFFGNQKALESLTSNKLNFKGSNFFKKKLMTEKIREDLFPACAIQSLIFFEEKGAKYLSIV